MRRVKGSQAPVRRTLGIAWPVPFPASQPLPYPLAAAREDARAMIIDMSRGIDPKAKEAAKQRDNEARKTNNFASVTEAFIAKHVRGLRSGPEVEAAIRRELLPRWGDKPVSQISRRNIVETLEEIAGSGKPYAAHKLYNYISKFFSWAMARHLYGIEVSPCTAIKPNEVIGAREARQRVLNNVEIREVWKAMEGLGYPAMPFVRLLLLTGQRLREGAEMTWAEVDLDKALWTIPAERMKGERAHEVPLASAALEILKSLPSWTGPFVFSTTGGERPISGFSKMKVKIDEAIARARQKNDIAEPIAPWRFHDLRRTMRTGLSGLPIPSNICELCIAHAQPGLHQVYDRHSYRDEKRRAFELWAARLAEIVEPGGSDNVVRLRKA
jgi:integrase